MSSIVDIQMAGLQTRLTDRDITLNLSTEARTWLADKGYDPQYGARPLKRVIQTHVQDKLAEALLQGKINSGDKIEVIKTDVPDGLLIQTAQETLKQTGS